MVSGAMSVLPNSERYRLYRAAYRYRVSNPSAVFKRNPAKLKQAWEMQAELREDFIEFFGGDLVILEGASVAQKWSDFYRYRTFVKTGKDGLTPAQRASQDGVTPVLPKPDIPADILASHTVGIICDVEECLNFYTNYALFQEAFEHPELALDRKHRETLWGYLKEASVSTLPFRRMAQMYPANSESVLGSLVGQPEFRLGTHFEKLMRRYKKSWIEKTIYPSVMPVETDMSQALLKGDSSEPGRLGGPAIDQLALMEEEARNRRQ